MIKHQWYRTLVEEGPEELQKVWVLQGDESGDYIDDPTYRYLREEYPGRARKYRKKWRMLPTKIETRVPIEGATGPTYTPNVNETISCVITVQNENS